MEPSLAAAQAVAQRSRTFANDRVLEQPGAKLFLALALVRLGKRQQRRQQTAGLQQNEARREREERGDLFCRQGVQRAHPHEIRVGEVAEAHRQDVELLLLDQLEQEVERTVEALDRDVRTLRADHHGSASRSARASRRSSASRGASWWRAISRTTRAGRPSISACAAPRCAWSR